ncbi:periplasmic glucans biosynthesis protein MdoH [Parvularcula bermudensis HTCC2503]|uniref:Glucans biosynthesis glucosyltransferase H n=1 Tax=Parvularcula bermudensis (strain ATCC BAA-594 / HTCC2503 / KCTC 12087) TaxID=314260 RepID=E0TFP2_PARBH|nr:glucans biosynthesis glucosyltransferase MdoH [Parvularcula bermudensis]ADM09057.1 periplasmic glucans biosynthesis protein MdoH [Parvularcula bermudensis HTCC2503]
MRPPEAPLAMPKQRLGDAAPRHRTPPRSLRWRKAAVGLGAIGITAFATREMYLVLAVAEMIPLEWALLSLFSINLAWITFGFVSATIGLVLVLTDRPRPSPPAQWRPRTKTAILFPVYNEDPAHICATVEAVAHALSTSAPGAFACFVLADTNRPGAALREEAALLALKAGEPTGCPIYYRRRTLNHERKSGNIEDFVRRWGAAFDHMIVFDADSYMETDTLLELVRRMEAAPDVGLIQTIPQLVGGRTVFARSQQFAAALYGPILGAGVAWWAGNEGNYWGHNAIIRLSAFAESAGLPAFPGTPPFGGPILSHDFIEAALLRKAGWKVLIARDLGGSYEEGPPSIIDLTIRDRRWCQGNLQHLSVLFRTRSMAWTNRLHLMIGIMSYLAAPLWMLLIGVGMALSLQAQFLRPEYFGNDISLFPRWPIIDSARALSLFGITMAILFAPKLYGLIYGLWTPLWRNTVGPLRLTAGVLAETVISVLIAPILLVAQSASVLAILTGQDSGWSPQHRRGGYAWGTILRRHGRTVLLGALLTTAAFAISPIFAAWLAPASIGMMLAPLLSKLTGSSALGGAAQRAGILITPYERDVPASVAAVTAREPSYAVLTAPDLNGLMADRYSRDQRAGLVDSLWILPPRTVHVPLATAIAKAEWLKDSETPLDDLLDDTEIMALLNDVTALEVATARWCGSNL